MTSVTTSVSADAVPEAEAEAEAAMVVDADLTVSSMVWLLSTVRENVLLPSRSSCGGLGRFDAGGGGGGGT